MRIQQDSSDRRSLLRSASSGSESDVEAQSRRERHKEPRELDRRKTVRRLSSSSSPSSSSNHAVHRRPSISQVRERVTEKVPPEWALLLVGCLLGLTTGLCVVAFNRGVHFIHDWAWAGTPHEGAAWLRLQRLADTWHRIMLIPVTGGVIVGVMHTMLAIIDQIITSRPPEPRRLDVLAGLCPTIKATQAAVTLGTGCSLGPEGPSVDIGKSCAIGYSELMKNNRQRKIALLAAGAAAGISSGFNAAVSGCFFAIETVLRPLHAENSPPLTTAMIILASVLSSTVSNTLLGERPAFIVPTYELKSAAELPLYLILGMVCGVVSVVFTWLVTWFTSVFDFIKERFGIPATVTPALGGLGVGIIALKYPGVLYWGFTNVDEILHAGKTASSPGISLLTQLVAAKVVATALCKGSGLVGGIYAPSLMIGSAVGAVFGDLAGKAINAAIPGHAAVAHPQAYALVGMAATLASACSVPLTSVLLLFELTKDYHILLPLMGAVGLAFWVAAVANQKKPSQGTEKSSLLSTFGGYTRLTKEDTHSPRSHRVWRKGEDNEVELCTIDGLVGPEMVSEEELLESIKVSQAMSKDFVKVSDTATIKEAVAAMLEAQQRCVLVVDENDLLEGIMTLSDLQHETLRAAMATSQGDPTILDSSSTLVAAVCTTERSRQGNKRDLVVCYPDTDLKSAQRLFAVKGVKQLPVVSHGEKRWQDGGRKLVALLHQEAITACLRKEATKRVMLINSHARSEDDEDISFGH